MAASLVCLWALHGQPRCVVASHGGLVGHAWFGVELGKFKSRLFACSSPRVQMNVELVMRAER
ncbi:hypothetical protein CDL15_Pgr011316 [Punica granatum]|uniref:Secreted protein n=1 Tax=Punica granatum TaxID=22663 RepID=A0A218WFB5_PUNGR|nr:hypothetical protein CDL15_Pgr011316 [Punica granatum]